MSAAACLDAPNKHTTESHSFPLMGVGGGGVEGPLFQTFLPLTFEISIVSPELQDVAVCLCVRGGCISSIPSRLNCLHVAKCPVHFGIDSAAH